jgi:hypothetical protein
MRRGREEEDGKERGEEEGYERGRIDDGIGEVGIDGNGREQKEEKRNEEDGRSISIVYNNNII